MYASRMNNVVMQQEVRGPWEGKKQGFVEDEKIEMNASII